MWRSAYASRFLLRTFSTAARTRVNRSLQPHRSPRPARSTDVHRNSIDSSFISVGGFRDGRSSDGCVERVEVQENGSACSEIHKDGEFLDSMPSEWQLVKKPIGSNISLPAKIKFLIDLFKGLKDSKEAVYGALDDWVAWEREFPLTAIKRALIVLQKEEQWHRIVQVLKWMLSKGQGDTMGTYEQLIRALDNDCRAEEAHDIWVRKISYDLHSTPWRVCELMISIYYRNNMLERLVKLFKGLEMFDRKPPNKSIVTKITDAYEALGLVDEKTRVMEKYAYIFEDRHRKLSRRPKRTTERKNPDPSENRNSRNTQDGASACTSAI